MKLQKINLDINLMFFLIILFLLIFILNTDVIYLINSLDKSLEIDNKLFFEDWEFIFSTIECKGLGYDITKVHPCDELGRLWWGDNIQFYIPYFTLRKRVEFNFTAMIQSVTDAILVSSSEHELKKIIDELKIEYDDKIGPKCDLSDLTQMYFNSCRTIF